MNANLLNIILLSVIRLNDIQEGVILLNVILLNSILSVILLNASMLNVILLSVVSLDAIVLRAILMNAILPNVILVSVILLIAIESCQPTANTMHTLVISFKFSYIESFPPTGSVKIRTVSAHPGPPFPQTSSFTQPFIKCLHLLKMPPFLITLLISFSFNNGATFCINIHVLVLINQYSTGPFVSYSVRRKIH
jgi:hypothetical protein